MNACAYSGIRAEEGETIGTGQLLIGILREENCIAAKILKGLGVHIVVVRGEVLRASATEAGVRNLRTLHSDETIPNTPLPLAGVVLDAETAKLIAQAIWTPVYGAEVAAIQGALQVNMNLGSWQIIGGPLFAVIRSMDGKVLAMGRNNEGTDV